MKQSSESLRLIASASKGDPEQKVASRGFVKIADLLASPRRELSVHMGPLDFAMGCGSGLGKVHLECVLSPSARSPEATRGALVLQLSRVANIPKMDLIGWADVYVSAAIVPTAYGAAPKAGGGPLGSMFKDKPAFRVKKTGVKTVKGKDHEAKLPA